MLGKLAVALIAMFLFTPFTNQLLAFALWADHPLLVMEDESMYPTINKWDLLLVNGHISLDSVREGNIIAFYERANPRTINVQRVLSITFSEGGPRLTLKSDASDIPSHKSYDEINYIGTLIELPFAGYSIPTRGVLGTTAIYFILEAPFVVFIWLILRRLHVHSFWRRFSPWGYDNKSMFLLIAMADAFLFLLVYKIANILTIWLFPWRMPGIDYLSFQMSAPVLILILPALNLVISRFTIDNIATPRSYYETIRIFINENASNISIMVVVYALFAIFLYIIVSKIYFGYKRPFTSRFRQGEYEELNPEENRTIWESIELILKEFEINLPLRVFRVFPTRDEQPRFTAFSSYEFFENRLTLILAIPSDLLTTLGERELKAMILHEMSHVTQDVDRLRRLTGRPAAIMPPAMMGFSLLITWTLNAFPHFDLVFFCFFLIFLSAGISLSVSYGFFSNRYGFFLKLREIRADAFVIVHMRDARPLISSASKLRWLWYLWQNTRERKSARKKIVSYLRKSLDSTPFYFSQLDNPTSKNPLPPFRGVFSRLSLEAPIFEQRRIFAGVIDDLLAGELKLKAKMKLPDSYLRLEIIKLKNSFKIGGAFEWYRLGESTEPPLLWKDVNDYIYINRGLSITEFARELGSHIIDPVLEIFIVDSILYLWLTGLIEVKWAPPPPLPLTN